MLPSLYVAHMQDRNYDSIIELQKGYMKVGSYENLEVKNPTGTLTVEIPLSGNAIYAVSKFFRITVDVRDQNMRDILEKLRYYAKHTDEIKDIREEDFDLSDIKDKLFINKELMENNPLKFDFELYKNEYVFQEVSSKIHIVSDDLMVFEANVTDGHNYYTTYIAMGITDHAIIFSFLPIMTPRIEEIRPVILQSLPMILAVALLLILVSSQLFSRVIINPIIKLANHAEYMKEVKNLKLEPIAITGHDEISSLGESLNGLYQKIQESYQELEVKNSYLAEENERQEVFLRASSHQLKTPITAALLLVQGMISEVGKYKDSKEYLPQVKLQLLSMQNIVEDILYLNRSQNLDMELLSLSELMDECRNIYHVQLEEKAINITTEGQIPQQKTDRELMKKILDNLLSNAIYFTPEGGKIKIIYEEHRLCIINYGVSIDEELLPHVFEPFVTSVNEKKQKSASLVNRNNAHGLGLYVVSYYAKFLHCQVKLHNIEEGVMAELILR
jgi:signal transduction histidine kinase